MTEERMMEIIKELQVNETKQMRALMYAEEVRLDSEQKMLKYRTELHEANRELADLKHKSPRRIGGTFRKREMFPAEHELIREYMPRGNYDEYQWKWTIEALRAGIGQGMYSVLPGESWCAMPLKVRADSWWHLCAQVGLTEGVARICYFHPEEGQESAVAKAKPIERGVKIYCQGDY